MEGIDPSELLKIIGNVDLKDAKQAEMAISAVNTMIKDTSINLEDPNKIRNNIYPTTTTTSTTTTPKAVVDPKGLLMNSIISLKYFFICPQRKLTHYFEKYLGLLCIFP